MSMQQQCFLNPKPKEVHLATTIDSAVGEGAMRKEAKRRINFWDGNINSHACCLNNKKTMQNNREFMALASIVGDINRGRQSEKDAAKEKKKKDEATMVAKKKANNSKLEEQKVVLMPDIEEDIGKGYEYVQGLTNLRLKEILFLTSTRREWAPRTRPTCTR